jgi:replicative DNA helicase
MLDAAEYEQSVAGSILIDPSCIPDVTAIVTADDFLYDRPRALFKAAVDMAAEDEPIDPVTVMERANKSGVKVDAGYIRELMAVTPTAANVLQYARLVKKESQKRYLRSVADTITDELSELAEPEEIAGAVLTMMDKMTAGTTQRLVASPDALREFYEYRAKLEQPGAKVLVRTNYSNLDAMMGGGLVNGNLIIIGARPGMGKTSTAVCLMEQIASAGMPVLFISLEMTRNEITAKRISRESGVPIEQTLMGMMGADEYKRVNAVCQRLHDHPVTITDDPRMTVNDIAMAARQIKGLRCLFIDHFSLITPSNRKAERTVQYTEISNDLKRLAKTLNIPIVCLAQLNRQNEARKDKRAMLSDLRETGAAEQDADAVIFIHRERYYQTDAPPLADYESEDMELIVAKNRHGKTGTLNMLWFGATGRIHAKMKG